MKENTMNLREYMYISIFWNAIAFMFYDILLFKSVLDLSSFISHIILVAMMVIVTMFNCFMTFEYSRNEGSIIKVILISLGLYSIIAYYKEKTMVCNILFIALLVLVATSMLYIWKNEANKIRSKNKKVSKKAHIRYKRYSYLIARYFCAGASLLLLCFLVTTNDSYEKVVLQNHTNEVFVYGDEYSFANNAEILINLDQQVFPGLTMKGKMEVLQTLCNVHARSLGIRKKVELRADDLDPGVLACYSTRTKEISIDTKHMNESQIKEVAQSLAHELFHMAQDDYVQAFEELDPSYRQLYFFNDVRQYEEEMINYVDGQTSFHNYYTQSLEAQARSYSVSSTKLIFDRIDEYKSMAGGVE